MKLESLTLLVTILLAIGACKAPKTPETNSKDAAAFFPPVTIGVVSTGPTLYNLPPSEKHYFRPFVNGLFDTATNWLDTAHFGLFVPNDMKCDSVFYGYRNDTLLEMLKYKQIPGTAAGIEYYERNLSEIFASHLGLPRDTVVKVYTVVVDYPDPFGGRKKRTGSVHYQSANDKILKDFLSKL